MLLLASSLLSCGFDTSYISSAPTVGQKTRGPVRIIRSPQVSLYLGPTNDLQTGQLNYVVLPILPFGGNSKEEFATMQTKGKFVVQFAFFANQKGLSLNFSDILLKLNRATYNVVKIQPNPYLYPKSQALREGSSDVMCPETQVVSGISPNSSVNLSNNGLWECYDLVFPVDAPSPRVNFQIDVTVKNMRSGKNYAFHVPFKAFKWGHADSIP